MSITSYKPRLILRVLWHSDFARGQDLARHIYSCFCRDAERPAARGLGIPVYLHSGSTSDAAIQPVSQALDDAESTVIVGLIDNSIRADETWIDALRALDKEIANSARRHLLLPVMCEDKVHSVLKKNNCIRLEVADFTDVPQIIVSAITHELARLLLAKSGDVPTEAFGVLEKSFAPVKLFLSHSKHGVDGNDIAMKLRDYGGQMLPVATFYDSNDIAPGHDFEKEIKAGVADSAMIVIHSNTYSDRPWCRKEVLLAKQYACPILVVNAVTQGEERLFPYLGNAPSVRWRGDDAKSCRVVMDAAVREVLRNVYFLQHVRTLKTAGLLPNTCIEVGTAPEMLTYRNLIRAKKCEWQKPAVLLYPDPPLGDEEIEILEDLNPSTPSNLKFVTPTATGVELTPGKEPPFKGRIIGISISNSPEFPPGMNLAHLEDAMVECARHLLSQGASIAYGGDLRRGGYTTILFDLVRAHNRAGSEERIHNFLSWPIHLHLDQAVWKDYLDEAKFHNLRPPDDLGLDETTFVAPDDVPGRYLWARSLTVMREEMTGRIAARILLGGQITGFRGKYPGILEEATLAVRAGRPLFLIGGFGGCTALLIDALKGGIPEAFTAKFQSGSDAQFYGLQKRYADAAVAGQAETLDYERELRTLYEAGFDGLKNGLSVEENEVLFKSTNVAQIVYLVLKGLSITLR